MKRKQLKIIKFTKLKNPMSDNKNQIKIKIKKIK